MHKPTEHILHARSLQADVLAASTIWIPRREVLLEWLSAFLKRAGAAAYSLGETEAADLKAIDQFLRRRKVPVALPSP